MALVDWFRHLLDPTALLQGFGNWILVGMGAVIFIESGVLFPFLPGDSLLVTAAILRNSLGITAWEIIAVSCVAAILGDQVGFWLGRNFGRRLFKPNARILKTENLDKAEAFFTKYGPLALVLGRFVPVVRTYVPLAAGTAGMRWPHFFMWNIIGAVGWVCAMVAVGVGLGQIPGIAHSIDLIMIIVVVISVLPIVIGWLNSRRKAKPAARTEHTHIDA